MPFTVVRGSSSSRPTQPSSLDVEVAQPANTTSAVRPPFNSQLTSERLRESSRLHVLVSQMGSKIEKGRRPVFKEIGLDIDSANTAHSLAARRHHPDHRQPEHQPSCPISPAQETSVPREKSVGNTSEVHVSKHPETTVTPRRHDSSSVVPSSNARPRIRKRQASEPSESWYSRFTGSRNRYRVQSTSGGPPQATPGLQRFALILALVCVVIPGFTLTSRNYQMEAGTAEAGVITKRETSPTDVCNRWAHQAAELNGTLYIYGGEAKKDESQESNTWNNYFLTLDLTEDWKTDKPALKGLEIPDGPPAVANGYLWRDYENLFLYGGQFADNPYKSPAAESLWKYNIQDQKWTEFQNPETSKGNFSEPAGQPVHRSAEGAGVSVPELGLSWYFGGHQDWATIPGWSRQIPRIYLNSLLEFTHPGYSNDGVDKIASGNGAGDGGIFRNITSGGIQADEFPNRADGILVFVPGWGKKGVLIGMAGGAKDVFTRNFETLTVYDIESSEWFHQEATGDIPGVRVNPCAVIASSPDASSFQIYMFGGQNLQPFEEQTQYDDMYILTLPSFTWIKADPGSKHAPSGRAGHTCTMRDGQIIVVGGYTGEDQPCDDPGIYVFDASSLKWTNEFKAGDHEADHHPDNSVLAGSWGYAVPDKVQKAIGGDEEGGATATQPDSGPATGGPFATGQAPVFTITQGGSTTTITPSSQPDSSDGEHESPPSADDNSGPNPGLIAAGVIAGVLGALALYLGFCTWLYRRQVAAYKQHIATTNRYSGASADAFAPAGLFSRRKERPASADSESFGWVGSERGRPIPFLTAEQTWHSDEPTPSGGSGSGTAKKSEERTSGSGNESTENLLEGREPSFFSVVMGPRRALRVVNGMD